MAQDERLRGWMSAMHSLPADEVMLDWLADRTLAPVEALPNTGVGLALEKFLSPVFIAGDDYGTRASTVLTLGQGRGVLVERVFTPAGRKARAGCRLPCKPVHARAEPDDLFVEGYPREAFSLLAALVVAALSPLAQAEYRNDMFNQNYVWETENPGKKKTVELPAYPDGKHWQEFEVGPTTRNRHAVDTATLRLDDDGVVRFAVRVQSPDGAGNADLTDGPALRNPRAQALRHWR